MDFFNLSGRFQTLINQYVLFTKYETFLPVFLKFMSYGLNV